MYNNGDRSSEMLIRKRKLINVSAKYMQNVYFIKFDHICYNLRCSHYQVLVGYPRELSCRVSKMKYMQKSVKLKCSFTGMLISQAERCKTRIFLSNYEINNQNRFYTFIKWEGELFIINFIHILVVTSENFLS